MKKPDLHPVRLEPSLESDLAELVRTDKPYNSREMVPHDIVAEPPAAPATPAPHKP